MQLSDATGIATIVVAVVTLAVTSVAVLVAVQTLSRGNRNASAATVVAINEAFRQSWERYFEALEAKNADSKNTALGEIANLMELAAAISHERTLAGVSQDIADDYLAQVLSYFERDDLRAELMALHQKPTTFQYIAAFLREPSRRAGHPKLLAALSTVPHPRRPGVGWKSPLGA